MELYPYVRSVVRGKIGDVPGWEDVVQEVYVSCFSSLERVGFNGHSSLKTWVHRITMRRVYDSFRKGYRTLPSPPAYPEVVVDDSLLPEDLFQRKETREKIESGFFVLTPEEKQVFVLLLNNWEIWEIAHVMKIPSIQVSELRSHGLYKLRKLYGVQNGR